MSKTPVFLGAYLSSEVAVRASSVPSLVTVTKLKQLVLYSKVDCFTLSSWIFLALFGSIYCFFTSLSACLFAFLTLSKLFCASFGSEVLWIYFIASSASFLILLICLVVASILVLRVTTLSSSSIIFLIDFGSKFCFFALSYSFFRSFSIFSTDFFCYSIDFSTTFTLLFAWSIWSWASPK